jgi:hypothetical protein
MRQLLWDSPPVKDDLQGALGSAETDGPRQIHRQADHSGTITVSVDGRIVRQEAWSVRELCFQESHVQSQTPVLLPLEFELPGQLRQGSLGVDQLLFQFLKPHPQFQPALQQRLHDHSQGRLEGRPTSGP